MRHLAIGIVACIALGAVLLLRGRATAFAPLTAVLPQSEAEALLTACDGAETQADSLWTPPGPVLIALDARLADRLLREGETAAGAPLWRYSRQYLGLYRGDRRLVFVNGVHEAYLQNAVELSVADGLRRSEAMHRLEQWFGAKAVDVCDGGEMFFHAEYDVSADSIFVFAFNSRG